MSKLLNVGFGNCVNTDKIISVISPDAAPIKRMVQHAKEAGRVIDATQGRRTKAVIVTENDFLVLSAHFNRIPSVNDLDMIWRGKAMSDRGILVVVSGFSGANQKRNFDECITRQVP